MNNSEIFCMVQSFQNILKKKQPVETYLKFFLTDQCFAVSNEYLKKNYKNKFSHYHMLGSGLTVWTIWQLSNLIGIWLGGIVSDQLSLNFFVITFWH